MKLLNGRDLADYIKERQAHQVRGLRQAHGIAPHLAIIRTNPDPVVDSYMRMKQQYGDDILIDVTVHTIDQSDALNTIAKLNDDPSVHGIIVQIPLPDPTQTTEILDSVAPHKDVDSLGANGIYEPATPMAIDWLLAGYNVDLRGKNIVIIGKGRLVGAPLADLWLASDYNVTSVDRSTENLASITIDADVIVTATGQPGLLRADMIRPDAIIVDAGVATDSNGLVGDVASDVRDLVKITITPEKGGVGPLTVSALFENVIRAAQRSMDA